MNHLYHNIRKFLGCQVFESGKALSPNELVVSANELEKELKEGIVVFGKSMNLYEVGVNANFIPTDKFAGLLIGYKPIENTKPVTTNEVLATLIKIEHNDPTGLVDDLIKRIELTGIK